ncbi:MAG: hypothetical protein GJ680_18930 [Alteromonadaceae bacterium]|nr:hypothetical protein [Alteromonadaceae bacterium]
MDPFVDINPVVLSGAVLFIAVLLEKSVKWPDKSHPLTLIRLFAKSMADKAVKDQRSEQQQKVAGIMAVLVLLLPIMIVTTTFLWFAEYTWFFNGFFLFIALMFEPVTAQVKKVESLLKNNKKALARNQLQRLVLRQVDNLSSMGIAKTAMETLILRFHYQYLCTLFWYLIFGGAGALLYRCCCELSQQWNIKQSRYRHFGRSVSWICLTLQWLPLRMGSMLFAITLGLGGSFSALKKLSGKVSAHTLVLSIFGGALHTELGGPAFYENRKIRLPKCGGNNPPEPNDIKRLLTLMLQYQIILFATILVCYFGAYSFSVSF